MSFLNYFIYIKSITKELSVEIDLLADNFEDKQVEINQLLNNDKEYFELELLLGSEIGKFLERPSQLEVLHQSIRDQLKSVIGSIQNIFGLEKILSLTYQNLDCLFSPEEILCQFIREFQFISNLNIYSIKQISVDQFNEILQAISFKREKLEKIHLEFSLKKEQTKIVIPKQLEQIKCLSLCNLTQQNQLNVFKLAKEIKEVEIKKEETFDDWYSKLKFEILIEELPFFKNSLEKLYIQVNVNPYLLSSNCLMPIEKLENLKSFHLEAANIQNQNFDVTKLKKLESLNLIFPDAVNYLSNHSNLPQLVELGIVIGSCYTNKLNLKQLNNLRILRLFMKFTDLGEGDKKIEFLQKFSEIAHQLNQLALDFSKYSQYFINIFYPELAQKIGIILEKCSEHTKVYLNNKDCQFKTQMIFELAKQIMKIQNYTQFCLNDICIYDQLKDVEEISDEKLQKDFPYYLSIFSQSQNQKRKIVNICWNQLEFSFLIYQRYISLFQNFKAFSLLSIKGYYLDNEFAQNFLQIVPENVEFLRLPNIFSLQKIVDHSQHLKSLKKIETRNRSLKQFMNNMGPQELKKCFSQKLHIKFNRILNYQQHKKIFEKLLEYEGYIFDITIDSFFKNKDLDDLFRYILNDKNIIYLKLLSQYDGSISYEEYQQTQEINQQITETINTFSKTAQILVLIINAFNQFIVLDINNLNSLLLLQDLYY